MLEKIELWFREIIVAVVGAGFAAMLAYLLGTSSVSYNIESGKIVYGGNAGDLIILDAKNDRVEGDVYVATVRIWNSGFVGITEEKSKPGILTISTPDNYRILSHKVITSFPDLGQEFEITIPSQACPSQACPSQSKLQIKFKSFSASSEITLSVVYTGAEGDKKLLVSERGVFADVRLNKVKTEIERKSYITIIRDIAISAGLFSVFMLPIIMLAHPAFVINPNASSSPYRIRIGLAQAAPVVIGLIVLILALIGWVVATLTNPLPPA